jgi:hypothetical protein
MRMEALRIAAAAPPDGGGAGYARHRSERTLLYQIIERH